MIKVAIISWAVLLNVRCLGLNPTSQLANKFPKNDYWEADDVYGAGGEGPRPTTAAASGETIAIFQRHRFSDDESHPFFVRAASQAKTAEVDLGTGGKNQSLLGPPPTEPGTPIEVTLSVLILQVRDIKELNEEVSLELNLRMYWKDSRLKFMFDEEAGAQRKFVAVSVKWLDRLWYPDIYLDHVKSISQPAIITKPASLRVYSDNTVRFSARFTIVMSCPMDFHMYPADTQKCGVDIKSYAFTNKILDLKWQEGRGAFLVDKLELPNFDVGLDLPENFTIETTSGSYAGVRFKVLLRRKISYHLLQTYFPSILFVTISWLSFLVSPESVPARMTLSMTTLLTLVSMFSSIRQGIPSVSYIKALDIWMVWCVLFVHFTLVEYAIVLKLISLAKAKRPAPSQVPAQIPDQLNSNQNDHSAAHFKGNIRTTSIEAPPDCVAGGGGGIPTIYNEAAACVKATEEFPDPTSNNSELHHRIALNLSNVGPGVQLRRKWFHGANSTSPTLQQQQLPHILLNNGAEAMPRPLTPNAPGGAIINGSPPPTDYKDPPRTLVQKIELYTSIIIPILFLIFNMLYWPWLLRALDYTLDTTEYYHL